MRLVNAPIMKSTMRSGRSMKPTLHFGDQRLGARARVARHDREHHRERRDHHVVGAAQLRVEVDQADEERDVGEAVDDRVPEAAELRSSASSSTRDLAVDEVEDVGDDHDDAGGDELAQRQRPGGGDVDEHADEREDVRVDPQRHARR